MRCLVLGGAGFIGSNVATALVKEGYQVRGFDRPNISLHNLRECINAVEIMTGDFCNINDMSAALKGVDVVVHLACSTVPGPSNENPIYDVETNVLGTISFLETALAEGVRRVIFASSGGTVYGIPESLPICETHPTNPICSYGITKLTSEKYLALFNHLYDLDYTVLRLGNAYGKGQRTNNVQGAVAVFLGKTMADENITVWGNGSVVRDYLCIDDLVAAFLKVIECKTQSKVYNVAGGHPYSLNEVLTIIRDTTGKNLQVEYAPHRSLDVPINYLNISLAAKELDWRPKISLREGISQFWSWLSREAARHPWGNNLPYQKEYSKNVARPSV